MTRDDSSLIHEFVADASQAAFTAIVQRHIDFVYSAALRQVGGDSGLASDISQAVFIDLVRKARSLPRNTVLPAWLHRATRLAALAALRAQQRRMVREQEAVRMQEIERAGENADWISVTEVIDETLDKLPEKDREAVLLRYFQKQSFREMGATLRMSEDGARMRVERALEKLRALLAKRGITSTGAALSAALSAQSTFATPAGLSLLISQAASAAITHSALTPLAIMATTKFKLGVAVIVSSGAIAIATREHFANRALETELARLNSQIKGEQFDRAAVQGKANSIDENELARLRAEHLELMRLRGEVAGLREAKAEAENLLAKTPRQESKEAEEPLDATKEIYKTIAMARMNFIHCWGMALIKFAEENGGMMPRTFAEASGHYPEEWASIMSAFDPEKFAIVFHGSLKEIAEPQKTIIVREKAPFPNLERHGFARTYLFADGHTEIHSSPDGNSEDWERARLVSPRPAIDSRN